MKKKYTLIFISAILALFITSRINCQTTMPETLLNGTLSEQFDYLEERTRIYENYRAIREDMFQLIKTNSNDSLATAKEKITKLISDVERLKINIDSTSGILVSVRTDLQEAIRTKNNIKVLGINLNKHAYNAIMWIIVATLAFLLGSGFLIFKRNLRVTFTNNKELEDLKQEFEDYRTKSRIEREKMSLDHFNEIKRLKGKK